jgi:serine/threonine-protein kinase
VTDRSNKAPEPVDAVSSPDLPNSTGRKGQIDRTAAAVSSPDLRNTPEQSSGLRRVTVTGSPSETSGAETSEERPSGTNQKAPRGPDPYIGCTIDDRYHVERILGEGGMGVVYRCRHTIIGKKVAMKVLRADLARNEEVTERFLNEAKSASSIGNPHIIDISDFGRLPDGSTYFIMEYLEGQSLSTLIDEGGPVPIPRLVHIAEQLAEGLFAAHRAGIIHRDLKPDNIFLVPRGGQDFVKILDFGIAKASSTEGRLTQAGQVFGTPHYMSPEQAAGSPIDHRADIYSVGVILYEMASGRVPFDADNFMGILTQHMYKSPVPIRALVPEPQDVPPGLEAILLKCLSKRPEQRYQTMRDLHDDLTRARQGDVPNAVAEMLGRSDGFKVPRDYFTGSGPVLRPASSGRTRWPLYAALFGIVLGGAVVAAIATRRPNHAAAPAAPVTAEPPHAATALASAQRQPAPPAEPERAPAAEPREVVLAVAPLDAHVYRGDQDLGTSPVVVELPEGETMTLHVRRKGYKEAQVVLDGSQRKLSVALEAERSVARPAPTPKVTPAPAAPSKKSSSSEIVNPWE